MVRGAVELPTAFAPITWHVHELLFGFVAAAIAGFLLTAIPNWTGRLPLQGWPLASLLLLWAAGRAAVAGSAWSGPRYRRRHRCRVPRGFYGGGRPRNRGRAELAQPAGRDALALLLAANVMIHAGALGRPGWEEAGKRLGISIVVSVRRL
jgi:uncharacterized protein involved in response to NO